MSSQSIMPPLRRTLFAWFSSEEAWLAWSLFSVLILLTLVSIYLSVRLNHFIHDFYQAINQRQIQAFFQQISLFFLLVILVVAEVCARAYLLSWTSFRWRQWMTHHYQHEWLSKQGFYRMHITPKPPVDNPDQRIAQDIAEISSSFLSLFLSILRAALSGLSFLIILYNLTAGLHIHYGQHAFSLSMILVTAAMLYACCMTGITIWIGYPLFQLSIEQEQREANFRYHLIRIREHSLEIAELQGEAFEERSLREHFSAIAHNFHRILKRTLYLNLFQNFYGNVMPFLPLIIAGPLFFQGLIGFGLLMQIHDVFNRVNDALAILALSYTDITSWMASVQRVRKLELSLLEQPSTPNTTTDSNSLSTHNLVLYRPDQQALWSVPDFVLAPQGCYLLAAPPGTGKSTLLRALTGLHTHYSGHILRPSGKQILLLPQTPYFPIGSLADAALYPHQDNEQCAQAAYALLPAFHLIHLAPIWQKTGPYQQQLSGGEKQRLQLLRLCLQAPDIALLDEPFCHLSTEEAEYLLATLRRHCPHTTLLIVTHHPLRHPELQALWP